MHNKSLALLAGLLTLLLLHTLSAQASEAAQTLKGEYTTWDDTASGDLEAVFTPTGPNQWDVDFHFSFNGEAHVYTGTAQGSLTGGELKGRVWSENRSRTFTFQGRFEDGTFQGSHSEMEDGEEYETGLLTLRR